VVIGSGGSGKTTFARRLAAGTGLPLTHLDQLYWRPGWQPTPDPEWREVVRRLISGDAWILDGNYGGTLDLRLEACDTAVFLDVPRRICLARVIARRLSHRGRSRRELPTGCPERWSLEFLAWIWTYPRRRRTEVLRRLAAFRAGQRSIVLRTDAQIEAFLAAEARFSPA